MEIIWNPASSRNRITCVSPPNTKWSGRVSGPGKLQRAPISAAFPVFRNTSPFGVSTDFTSIKKDLKSGMWENTSISETNSYFRWIASKYPACMGNPLDFALLTLGSMGSSPSITLPWGATCITASTNSPKPAPTSSQEIGLPCKITSWKIELIKVLYMATLLAIRVPTTSNCSALWTPSWTALSICWDEGRGLT